MLIICLIFVVVVAAIVGAYWLLVVVPENREQTMLKRRLKGVEPSKAPGKLSLFKKPERLSEIPVLDAALQRSGKLTGGIRAVLERSGLRLNLGRFLLLSATSGGAAYLTVFRLSRVAWLSGLAMAIAAALPLFVVKIAATRRIRKFEEQFPEAIDLIARAMRAGHAFATGLKMAADEMPAPAGVEFRRLYERQNYGAQLSVALKAFADAVPLLDARFFVTAVMTQRETGGNLAEVLDRLAAVMRERFRIKRDVRVRSAHGRMTAFILAGLPPALAVLLMMSNAHQFGVLFTDPMGIRMLEVAATLQLVGVLIVRKLVNIEY